MTSARITVEVGSSTRGYELRDIDFDASRNEIVKNIGGTIIDGIWEDVEG